VQANGPKSYKSVSARKSAGGTSVFRTHCSSMRTHFLRIFFLVLPLLHWAACSADDAIGLLDKDKNGVLDIEEVETAASKLFSGLDRDKRIRLMPPSSRGGLMLRPLGTAIPIMTARPN
jgi:hypothetical protein